MLELRRDVRFKGKKIRKRRESARVVSDKFTGRLLKERKKKFQRTTF